MTVNPTKNNTFPPITAQNYELEDAIGSGIVEFTGVQIAFSTSRSSYKPEARWTDMALYRITEGDNAGLYILEIVGCSDVYHRVGSSCKGSINGKKIAATELPEKGAQECFHCHPGTAAKGNLSAEVALEVDWPQLTRCKTPQDVLNRLRDGSFGVISNPAQRLLLEASQKDSGMHAALNRVERL